MTALPRIAALLVLTVVGTLAFVLSFTALADLAARHAVPTGQAWMIPVVVDATILAATLAVVSLDERRWYAWTLLGAAAALSVSGNVAHAWEHGAIAVVIAAVPPVFLLAMTELAVVLTRAPARPALAAVEPLFPAGLQAATATEVPDLTGSFRDRRAAARPA